MTQPETSDSPTRRAAARRGRAGAEVIRRQLIDLTYKLPNPSPQEVLDAWNQAHSAVRKLEDLLEAMQ